MNQPIEIPIFYNTDETSKLEDLNIFVPLRDCEIRNVYFFNINLVSEYIEEDCRFAKIHSNGDTFISTLSLIEVLNKINK